MRRREGRRPGISLFTVFLLAMILLLTGAAMARYMTEHSQSGLLEADNFYFTSDFLKEEAENAVYFIDPLKTSLSVNLFNYADSQRVMSAPVKYKVTAEGGTVVSGEESGSIVPGTEASGFAKSASVSVVLPALAGEQTGQVTVTAVSTSPYQKTLTAVFKREKGNEYVVEDAAGNTAAVLTMTCTDSGKAIRITLPEGVIPDAANDWVSGYDSVGKTLQFSSQGGGVYSLVLLKSNPDVNLTQEGTFADDIVIGDGQAAAD